MTGSHRHHHRRDRAHHHPLVHHIGTAWAWDCACGGSSPRGPQHVLSWHEAVVQALTHATTIAA
jgi:hypothetical protein